MATRRSRSLSATLSINAGLLVLVHGWLRLPPKTHWEAASGRSCRVSGCVIPSSTLGPTPISYLWFDTRSALPAILRDVILANRRSPGLNVGLPDHWFVNFYPSNDIRINFGDPISGQTGRLFLPFDFSFGRKITDSWTISLEASVPIVKDYPVYNFKTEREAILIACGL